MRLTHTMLAVLTFALASGSPITWTLTGVTFAGGGTATGSFTFNPDVGTNACSTGLSPCGTFSNINITTTTGGGVTGAHYVSVCGTDVVSCNGVSPDSTEVLFLTSAAANQSGLPAIAFFFTGIGGIPPMGLTDAGGFIDVSNSSASVGAINEALCLDTTCSTPSLPSRAGNAGTVNAVPEPSTLLLFAPLSIFALSRLRRKLA